MKYAREFVGYCGFLLIGYGLYQWSQPCAAVYAGVLFVVLAATEFPERRRRE